MHERSIWARFVSILYEGTQTNWNGIVGGMELRAVDPVAIDDLQVYPDVEHKRARVRVRLTSTLERPVKATLELAVKARNGSTVLASDHVQVAVDRSAEVVRELDLGADVKLWDEFTPRLHVLNGTVTATSEGKTYRDERAVRFGMRSFAADGTRFRAQRPPHLSPGNARMRDLSAHRLPANQCGRWRRIYRTIKSYGLNFMRFHSWCPPEAAFEAADLEGVILQPEGPRPTSMPESIPPATPSSRPSCCGWSAPTAIIRRSA